MKISSKHTGSRIRETLQESKEIKEIKSQDVLFANCHLALFGSVTNSAIVPENTSKSGAMVNTVKVA